MSMPNMPSIGDNKGGKSFWETPSGTTGMICIILGTFGVGAFLYTFLPFLVSILQNTLYAGVLAIAIGILLYVFVIDSRMRNLMFYMFKSAMRFITQLFIEIDPIGILKTYTTTLRENLDSMQKQIGNLRGQMSKLNTLIDANKKELENSLKLAGRANQDGKRSVFVLQSRKAGRKKESNMTLTTLYTKMEVMYRVLNKMYESSSLLIEDIEDEIIVKTKERDMIRASYSAFKSAQKIINGDRDKKEMFDQTMEYLADDYGKKLGEIQNFMDISSSFIDSIDLQNGVYEEEALELLERWEKEGDSILLGDSKNMLIAEAHDVNNVIDLKSKSIETHDAGYGKLFK